MFFHKPNPKPFTKNAKGAHDRASLYVNGVKLSGTNTGGLDIPLFTIDVRVNPITATCNKTFNECYDLYSTDAMAGALAEIITPANTLKMPMGVYGAYLNAYMSYVIFNDQGAPVADIMYYANDTPYYNEPSGLKGAVNTPTATKGTISNHAVSVKPSVTSITGYITGETKTGTAVTVSASELVSGSETKTANGTYDVTNLAQVVVNVSGGESKNAQSAQSTTRSTSTTYTEVISLTCSKTGTYDIYWSTFRSSTSGTWGSQLYINNTAYGSAQTGSWSNHIQNIYLSNVQIDANEEVAVRVRSRGSNYYGYVGTLTIIEQ